MVFQCVLYIFIHLSVDGPIGWFQFLAVINNAAMNTGVQVALVFFSDIYSRMKLLDHVTVL